MSNLFPFSDSSPAKIMVVSGDLDIAAVWAFTLQQADLTTCLAPQTDEAIQICTTEQPDLIVVDSQAWQQGDIEICRKLRGATIVPILLFTSNNNEAYLLEAYKVGIDDVITQVVSPRLFLAKVRAWLRRVRALPNIGIEGSQVSGLRLDPNKNQLWRDHDTPIHLSHKEVRLLELLMRQPGRLVETPLLIKLIWGQYEEGERTKLKHLVYHLRQKIEPDPDNPIYLLTEGYRGYRFSPG